MSVLEQQPRRRFSPGLIWLHWVFVNAATVGVFAAPITALVKPGLSPTSPIESIGWLLILPAFCVLMYLQMIVLRGAGLKFGYWGLATFAGLVIALFASLIVVTIARELTSSLPWGNVRELISNGAGHAVFGIMVGVLQTTQFGRTSGQHLMWCIASGVAAAGMGCVALVDDSRVYRVVGPAMIATLLGAIYGAITGLALVWILIEPEPEPEYD